MKKEFLFLLIALLNFSDADAQLLKGLKEKVTSKISGLDKKGAEKSSAKADTTIEMSTEDVNGDGKVNPTKIGFGPMSVDPSVLPDSYVFPYLYKIRMHVDGENIDMDYYLTKSGKYLGTSLKSKDEMSVIMVNDYEKSLIVNYIDGQPFVMRMPKSKEVPEENKEVNFKITDLPNKTLLGYNCKGKQLEDDLSIINVYVASDLGAGMYNPFENQAASSNKSIKLRNIKYDPGVLMYMTITDKKKGNKKDTIIIECTAFEEKQTLLKNR